MEGPPQKLTMECHHRRSTAEGHHRSLPWKVTMEGPLQKVTTEAYHGRSTVEAYCGRPTVESKGYHGRSLQKLTAEAYNGGIPMISLTVVGAMFDFSWQPLI